MDGVIGRLGAALADRYRIERELGAGGMATVYLAHDTRHDRKVALKVLRSELAAVIGAQRFLAEIKTTANLQHPHILPLHDSGEVNGTVFYVMPHIDGESLRDRLTREKQLPVDQAIRLTREVAEALDYAHRHGVIHRDIKPENILLHDGKALVADFGIALAVSAVGGTRMTETGMSLGTPHYMSPEQAMGEREVTARSDVYALGCVLYEMLVGEPPFTGPTAQAIIARVVTEEPRSLTVERRTVPLHIEAAVHKALSKLPADRFESAAAFAAALDAKGPPDEWRPLAAARGRPASRLALAGWGAGAVGVLLAAWALLNRGPSSAEATEARYLSLVLPDSAPMAFIGEGTLGVGRRAMDLSPDGRRLVYVGRETGTERLYVRALDSYAVTPLAGTEGAYQPFFSPDGQWVGYFVGAELRKVPVSGGTSVPLATVPEESGAAWTGTGRILIAAREGMELWWVPESGGPPQLVANPQNIQRTIPSLLPGGRHALVALWSTTLGQFIGVTDLESGRSLALTADGPVAADSVQRNALLVGNAPRYVSPGYLVYSTRSGLMAAAFDSSTFRLASRPVEVLGDVRREPNETQYVTGSDGALVYGAGDHGAVGAFVWATRDGAVDSLGIAPQEYGTFELSPDGRRLVALVFPVTGPAEIRVYDLARGTESKVATRGVPSQPRWWPDGRRIVYTETSTGYPYTAVTVRQLVESAGERDTIGGGWEISDIAPDTTQTAGMRGFGGGAWIFPLDPNGEVVPIDSFPTAWGPTYSSDGRWIAYTSNESGQYEVYVAPADRRGERQKVSLNGGEEPLWAPRTGELIYRWGKRWYAATVPTPGSTAFGRPRVILSGSFVNVPERSHDLSPDGRRHLLILGPLQETVGHLNVITNWREEVKRRVGR